MDVMQPGVGFADGRKMLNNGLSELNCATQRGLGCGRAPARRPGLRYPAVDGDGGPPVLMALMLNSEYVELSRRIMSR